MTDFAVIDFKTADEQSCSFCNGRSYGIFPL